MGDLVQFEKYKKIKDEECWPGLNSFKKKGQLILFSEFKKRLFIKKYMENLTILDENTYEKLKKDLSKIFDYLSFLKEIRKNDSSS